MIRTILSLLAVLTFLAVATVGTAREPAPRKKTEPPKEKYYVYGGNCSRSIGLKGTYETLDEAFAAAEKFRTGGMKWLTVRTGETSAKDYFGASATQYQVYCRSPRCGNWFLHATVQSADKAKGMAEKLKTQFSPVEIVGLYAAE
jgi:hypothetical protein